MKNYKISIGANAKCKHRNFNDLKTKTMEEKEMIQIAKTAIDKRMDYETLKYSDYMYEKESLTEDVWEYVIEAEEQGMNWFMETYAEYLC